ncbi:MAG: CRTAC1 family protein [Saprospiraceae bacterium]|nr:CRTAC1 family protein [Saprospiraceae bacterium]
MIHNRLLKYCFFLLIVIITSCTDETPETLFRQLSPEETNITFANNLLESEDFNIIEYLYFYNGAGVAVGDINNDDLPDIFFTSNQGPSKLYVNKGGLKFEDISKKAGITEDFHWKTGVTMADVNGDGWLDIYVCHVGKYKFLNSRNQLYINNQDGTFAEKASEYGLDFQGFSTQSAFFDYDRDGDLDMYLLNHSIHDTDNFGKSHLRLQIDSLTGDRLYRNDDGRFTNITQESGIYSSKIGYGLGVAIGDVNDDGWPDIYISNDFHENDYLYYNTGDGTLSEAGDSSFGHTSNFSMGSDMADVNNDGLLDVFTLDMKPEDESVLKSSVGADPYNIYRFKLEYGYHYQYPRNMLQLNRGAGRGEFSKPATSVGNAIFSEVAEIAGLDATDWSWSALLCDLDNDGWKDIFISNGIWRRPNDLDYLKFTSNKEVQQNATDMQLAGKMPSGLVPNYAYRNQGNLSFEKVSEKWGLNFTGCSNGAAYGDLDNDGDLDLVTNNINVSASVFENRSDEKIKNNFLKIKLIDSYSKNSFGIGARVEIITNEHRQVQELYATRGFQSASESVLIFGLGQAQQVDSLIIRWSDGGVQFLQNVPINQLLKIEKLNNLPKESFTKILHPLLEDISSQLKINFTHQENNYNDFDQEKLIPHKLSEQGPKLAVGDVNGDGLEDFYICGAAGQAGALFLQTKIMIFKKLQI